MTTHHAAPRPIGSQQLPFGPNGPYPPYQAGPIQPPQSQPAPETLHVEPKKTRKWPYAAGAAALLLAVAIAGGGNNNEEPSLIAPSSPASSSYEASPTPTDLSGNIQKSDIKLHVKTLSKKCYGYGIGCNVEYRVVVDGAYMSDWPDTGEVEVGYKIVGPEDGPESNSFMITLDGRQYEEPWEEVTSIRSRDTKLTVKITDIEYSEE